MTTTRGDFGLPTSVYTWTGMDLTFTELQQQFDQFYFIFIQTWQQPIGY